MKKLTVISVDWVDDKGNGWDAGRVLRTTANLAHALVKQGSHRYTTKSKLKSYLNRQFRLTRTMRIVEGFKMNGTELTQFKFKNHGNTYVNIPTGKRHGWQKALAPKYDYKHGAQLLVAAFN